MSHWSIERNYTEVSFVMLALRQAKPVCKHRAARICKQIMAYLPVCCCV